MIQYRIFEAGNASPSAPDYMVEVEVETVEESVQRVQKWKALGYSVQVRSVSDWQDVDAGDTSEIDPLA